MASISEDITLRKPSFRASGIPKRKSIDLRSEGLVKTDFLNREKKFPLVVEPAFEELNLIAWAEKNKEFIESNLLDHGAILFRNFANQAVEDFQRFIQTASGELLDYTYRSTPRKRVGGNVFTSTEYPPEMPIFLHNENSYSRNWAMKLFFLCVYSADSGGETPIADSRTIYERIDAEIRERFTREKVMYVRNYGSDVDLSWENVFQTDSKAEVEDYCRKADMSFEWLGNERLRTRQICQSVAAHPKTGKMVWFNQANLFHVSSLPTEIQNSLMSNYEEEFLPRNVYFGDGERIEASVIEHINQVYSHESVSFPWQKGDILMLDNMLTAHGRNPFTGQRKIVVGMSEPFSNGILSLD
jgi:alpha-ketoglutarate-dependent taurine dioxygenase